MASVETLLKERITELVQYQTRLDAVTAERDQLREALEAIAAHRIDNLFTSEVINTARAALAGSAPDA